MKRSLLAVIAVSAAGVLAGGAWLASRSAGLPAPSAPLANGSQPAGSGTAARLLTLAQDMLAAHRKIIVLLADEQTLAASERDAANAAGQALFHENQARLATLEAELAAAMKAAPANGLTAIDGLLAYVESGAGLFDADRLAFRELLHALHRLAAAQQTLPAIKLHQRLSEDLDALTEIERQYEREIKAIFARFDARAIDLKRERWEDYLAQLRKLYAREQILKDFGTIIPYPPPRAAPAASAASAKKGGAGEGGRAAREEEGEIFGYSLPPKTVALTFDDGPHGVYTGEIAAILKQYNVPAAFFQVGRNLGSVAASGEAKLNPRAEAARKLLAGGHVLANHSYSHAQLSRQTGDALRAEIAQTDQLLKAVDPQRSPLFRFPYGARNAEGMAMLTRLQLRSVMWNIDSQDWADPVPASIASRVLRTLDKEQRGIILFHDIHERTVKALPLVLERLVADGYRFAAWDGAGFRVVSASQTPGQTQGQTLAGRAVASPGYQNSWAVVVGIDDYAKWPKLNYAVRDAQALRQMLIERFGFARERVLMLTNGDATRANILALFNQHLGGATAGVAGAAGGVAAASKVKRDDRLLVFFAGHGATRKLSSGRDLGYIVPVDSDPQQFSTDAIPMTELQNIAESLEAKHVLFVMDACYSGLGLTRGGTSRFLTGNARRLGRQMLTAGGADQLVADGGPNGHSIFTWTLLQALGGKGDLNGDGMITATELAAYVAPAVAGVSQQTPAFGSLPGSEGGEFVFELQSDPESLTAQTAQLPADAIALNKKLDETRAKAAPPTGATAAGTVSQAAAIVIKDLQGGEQKITPPAPVHASARQLAQRANELGMQHYREKRYSEAEAAFTEALKLRPDFGLAANNLGYVYFKQDQQAEAARWFENALRIDPSRAVAYLNLGDARVKLGEPDKAKQAYRTYLALLPSGAGAAHVKAQLDKL